MKKAFTLIELLVVVLIISILAAVAVPQYQKAVEKSRISTALPVMDSLKKSIDIYLLENGYPNSAVSFLWSGTTEPSNAIESAIDVRARLDCSSPYYLCTDGTFFYDAMCGGGSGCYVDGYRSMDTYNDSEDGYFVSLARSASTNEWEYRCYYFDDFGERACSTLQGQGNWQIIDGNE